MKKRLLITVLGLFLLLGYSCENSLDDINEEQIEELQGTSTDPSEDDDVEDVLPDERESTVTS